MAFVETFNLIVLILSQDIYVLARHVKLTLIVMKIIALMEFVLNYLNHALTLSQVIIVLVINAQMILIVIQPIVREATATTEVKIVKTHYQEVLCF